MRHKPQTLMIRAFEDANCGNTTRVVGVPMGPDSLGLIVRELHSVPWPSPGRGQPIVLLRYHPVNSTCGW